MNVGYGAKGNGHDLAQMTPARETQVSMKMGALGASLDLLEKEIAMLEDRLQPVLGPEIPTPAGDQTEKHNPLVPLADRLQHHVMHAETLRSRINSLIVRLEV